MKKNKVLITGGAGYLGSVLTGHLLNEGNKVTCLDNLMYGQKSVFIYADNPDFDFVYGDVRDKSLLERVVRDFDVIIPLAAIVGAPACDLKPADAETINHDAIIMLDRLRSKNQRLVFPTTNSGYGTKSGEVFCTEETPLEPVSLYGVTKAEAEKALLGSEKGAITLRLATVFGVSPRMRTDLLVNDFVLKAVKDKCLVIFEGHSKRNYVHIRDIARCFEHCITNYDFMKGEVYNVGLEEANLSKIELAEKIREHLPQTVIIENEIGKDPDKRNYIVSNRKILSTGFTTIFSLDDGIMELIKGFSILLRNDPYKNV